MLPKLTIEPITFQEACEFIKKYHRHHKPPQGWKFGTSVCADGRLVGAITIGRPVSRMLDDGQTLEVTRCCTDGTKNVGSMLYAAAWRATRALGYKRLITYTLEQEKGKSLEAAGYKVLHQTRGGSWSVPSRPRIDKHPLEPKTCWGVYVT